MYCKHVRFLMVRKLSACVKVSTSQNYDRENQLWLKTPEDFPTFAPICMPLDFIHVFFFFFSLEGSLCLCVQGAIIFIMEH